MLEFRGTTPTTFSTRGNISQKCKKILAGLL